jgi:glycosyltransferase involved in cell wall biosynthesis
MIVDLLIPALNEEESLPFVLEAIPKVLLRDVYVIDNGSTDATARVAIEAGAKLLTEPERGYGAACLRGITHLSGLRQPPEIVAFLDGDFADDPRDLHRLLRPFERRDVDLVIGSRSLGHAEEGALTIQQRIGNRLAVRLIQLVYGKRYTDLGPFRAIRFPALMALGMSDRNYGWTVEMQIKAVKAGLRVVEVPVDYRRRAGGKSKVSSTVRGTLGASYKIVYSILRHATAR